MQKFPQIGLRAVFEITGFSRNYRQFERAVRDIDRITKKTADGVTDSGKEMSRATQKIGRDFARTAEELIQKSSALRDIAATGLLGPGPIQAIADELASLGGAIDVTAFDELFNAGSSTREAMRGAAVSAEEAAKAMSEAGTASRQVAGDAGQASQSINLLGREFTTSAIAIGAVTTALGVSIRFVQQSIASYTELAEATRRLSAETGILSAEASGWVQVAQASGVSATTASRGMSMFLSRVSDLRREQELGRESTGDFAEALDFLDVSITDSAGDLKSSEQLLADVNAAFQRLGPGIQTAGAATDLFGRTGRQLLPILTDQNQSLADYERTLDRFGARLSALDEKEYQEFLQSQFELRAALQGVANTIGSNWIPILGGVADVASEVIGIYNTFVRELFGVDFGVQTLSDSLSLHADRLAKINLVIQIIIQGYKDLIGIVNPLAGAYFRLAEAEEESARARAQAAQAASAARQAEEDRQRAIQETIESLNEIKGQYIQKLSDIDREAARKWEDILVNRQRDAFDRAMQVTFRLVDLQAAYRDRLDAIEADAAKRWEDILVNRQRDALLRGLRLAFRYEDLARSAERSRLNAIRDAADREAQFRRDAQRRVEDAERDAQRRREDLEREHQRRIRDIRQQFIDTATEAARRNDAVAVARAQRQRARELRDEQQRYNDERGDLERALQEKREDIQRDRIQREQEHRDELARALRRIEENYARQREELERQNQRERLLREIRYQWELEDFEAAKAEQLQAADEWRARQLAEMQKAFDREEILRRVQYRRQKEDADKAWRERIDDANEWYAKERDELASHLSLTGEQLEAVYADWAIAAAEAAAAVARAASDALAEEIIRYQHLLTEAQRARAQVQLPQSGQPVAPLAPPLRMRRNEEGVWVPGAPVLGMAEGGVVQASSPTHIVMGEGGPEMGIFLPGSSRSMTVNHNFGRMGVDFAGLPGGMNTQQVQAIVYSVMTQLARGIQVPRS